MLVSLLLAFQACPACSAVVGWFGDVEYLLVSGSCCYTSETCLRCFGLGSVWYLRLHPYFASNLPLALPSWFSVVAVGAWWATHAVLPEGKFGKAAQSCMAQFTGEMLQHPGLPWSTDGRGNYSYSSKRINNFSRQPHACYSFPQNLDLAGPRASWLSQENQLWVNFSSGLGEFPERPVFPLN